MQIIERKSGKPAIEVNPAGCDCPECDCEPGCKCGGCPCCE